MGDDNSGRVVGVSIWCIAHVWHTRVNISVGSIYIFWFLKYKDLYICILFSKSIFSVKKHWWSLSLFWSNKVQRMFSTTYELSHLKLKPQTILWWFYTNVITFTLWHFIEIMSCVIIHICRCTPYVKSIAITLVNRGRKRGRTKTLTQ